MRGRASLSFISALVRPRTDRRATGLGAADDVSIHGRWATTFADRAACNAAALRGRTGRARFPCAQGVGVLTAVTVEFAPEEAVGLALPFAASSELIMLAADEVAGDPVEVSVPSVDPWVCCTVAEDGPEVGPEDVVGDGVADGEAAAEGDRVAEGAVRVRETPVVAAACPCCPSSAPAPNTATTTSDAVPAPSAIRRRRTLRRPPSTARSTVLGSTGSGSASTCRNTPSTRSWSLCCSWACSWARVTSPFIDVHQIFPDQLT